VVVQIINKCKLGWCLKEKRISGGHIQQFLYLQCCSAITNVPGPKHAVSLLTVLVPSFTDCQCNGHSKCINRNICEKCEHQTSGEPKLLFNIRCIMFSSWKGADITFRKNLKVLPTSSIPTAHIKSDRDYNTTRVT